MFFLDRPYCTRNGKQARAIAAPDGFLYGWIESSPHNLGRAKWTADGTYCPVGGSPFGGSLDFGLAVARTDPNDLVNVAALDHAATNAATRRPKFRVGEVLTGYGFVVDQDGDLYQFNCDLGTITRV